MTLTENDKNRITDLIRAGEKLPKEYICKLFSDEDDVFLLWNGRKEEITNVALPFRSIEQINEPRKEAAKSGEDSEVSDMRGRQIRGWTNKLIWGDNKLILSSLANGPLRKEIENQGGLKLIYTDPPFAVGSDFVFNIKIGDKTAEKKQSIIEEIAYRDTWGKGVSSYLTMMYERLKLMHHLLAEDGSLYVHADWRVTAYLRLLLNDIFGSSAENFRNEIIWCYQGPGSPGMRQFNRKHDNILWYTKSDKWIFNGNDIRIPHSEKTKTNFKDGLRGSGFTADNYALNDGKIPEDWWEMPIAQRFPSDGVKRTGYPTEKPWALLERLIRAGSNKGDLIADFFCGSGTTAAVAETLGRKWIACDSERFAIHTARKRLIGVQRELKKNGKNFRAFEILNLGKYERQFFMNDLSNCAGKSRKDIWLSLILGAYKAKRIKGHSTLHGSRADSFVHVAPPDVPVTQNCLESIFEECQQNRYPRADVLGFEFETDLMPRFIQKLREKGVSLTLKYIPRDVFDKRAMEKGHVKFYDVACLNAKIRKKGKTVTVELTDFVTHYTQDDIEEVRQSVKKGGSVVIEDGQIFKIEKDTNGIISRTLLTENWHDWIDYWAADFNYEDKKEIIKIRTDKGETEEQTGNSLFENRWQSFRTKKRPALEFVSAPYKYRQAGKYKIMVKVVDIMGIDTSKIINIKI